MNQVLPAYLGLKAEICLCASKIGVNLFGGIFLAADRKEVSTMSQLLYRTSFNLNKYQNYNVNNKKS